MASESAPAAAPAAQSYSTDPALYIYTSLTAGSSHIVTATSRLETILRANRVPFKAIDIAVDEKARMLWGRRAGKDANGRQRKIPGLVQMGLVLGDLVEIEEWNEYGELKQHVEIYYDDFTIPSKAQAPPPIVQKPVTTDKPSLPPVAPQNLVKATTPAPQHPAALPIRSIVEEAAQRARKIQLDALRSKAAAASAKVQENEGKGEEKKEKQETPAGLQSPTSTGWKSSGDKSIETTIQSPTTTSWKGSLPKDVDPPVTNLHGSPIESASKEEIEAIEKAETIKEVSSEEEESGEEEKHAEKKGDEK
ncbi:hypothetical protein QBC40DRAFT_211026 [Triangularia verruculosa]|uniref:Uncharacterized protein n=1 Tax=Triangularia verruculosa TaxID=2587418 RepID=A0AAN6X7R3_9PEZI|nr:hypothetical protein QBC40DRAFT_211026 [Triangularia verruculosa]